MSYGQYSQNPYHQGPEQETGHGYPPSNPYAHDQYEMQDYNNNAGPAQAAAPILSQQDFLNKVQSLRNEIKSLTTDIDYIGQLHQRTLSSTDGQARDQLEHYVTQTQIRNTAIKDGIKALERDLARTTDGSRNTKNTQLQSLKTFFRSELDKYQSIERDYQHRYREQIARQYRIVNPEASEQEVQQATEMDWGNEGVFQTALRTNKTGHASSILGNVRARHSELQRIEKTLVELARLYDELATVVEQQDPVIQAAETNAENTVDNIGKGNEQVAIANKHARNRRKLKWWCALVVFLIILAIALGVGLGISLTRNNS
ncbi:Syntaxin-like protein-like protein [Hapsidospora chrysogenum ATCC 11550]|uniref:Syntaxin-like protein-like protein n=1 Tax=Hapsidospora chrysogenum (strain ATCC 11550 / CBS 779.69 / DSM 880 / IAM 14645 / JCM 23072 / IMI 49137) TaxID=857340 RepID=A0A086SUN6_HAPC1|nr:Syntaxin-like protein-like protein [Hapsidospora chrysogenum ATCC 11550]